MITDEMIADALAEWERALLETLPDERECNHVFSESFEKKMKRVIRKANYYPVYQVLQRAACFFVALFLSGSLLLAFHPTVRAAVVDWVQERFGEFYHYFFVGDEERRVSADGLTYTLGWVPEGYELVDSVESEISRMTIYADESKRLLQFINVLNSADLDLFLGDLLYADKKIVCFDDVSLEIYCSIDAKKPNVAVLSLENGDALFVVSAYMDEKDLLKLAKNVNKQEQKPY